MSYPDACIHELFERQAARTPSAVALIGPDAQITFGELDSWSNRIARTLAQRGVKRETFVGLCLGRSIPAIAALIGILKAGGAYVYLDPGYPASRLKEMARDSGLALVIAGHAQRDILGEGTPLEFLDPASEEVSRQSSDAVHYGAALDDAAYIIYTSGSTGRPKGAVEIHRSMTSRLISAPLPDIQPADVCCLNSSLSFGISASRLFFPLVQGASVVVAPEEDVKDVQRFVDILEQHQVSSVFMVPALLRQVLRLREQGTCLLRPLRSVAVSGGALTADLIRRFGRALPHAQLINIYGSTEIGTTAAMRVIDARSHSGPVSIGTPAANTKIYILAPDLTPVAPGATGEICVSAAHLAREYLNRPDLTAQRFLADPFGGPGERTCRTGDLGRWLPNGEIEFLGRADHQVKIRGYRIEMEEIESVLLEHASVREAAVVARGPEEEKRLVAFVVANGGRTDLSDLRKFLQERLPEYMIPAVFAELPELPLTDAGKVDRAALPDPQDLRRTAKGGPPESQVERSLAALWGELLKVETIGVDDNFIELGGDSLAATQLLAAIHGQFGVRLPARAAFDLSLGELAGEVLSHGRRAQASA